MYAPLWLAHRDEEDDGEIPATYLEPVDYRILHLRFAGRTDDVIAADVDRSIDEVKARATRDCFLAAQTEVERGLLQAIIKQGEYEPTTLAKAAAPEAMRRIIRQSQAERDPRTRLAANKTVLQFAGVEPPRRLEITTPDRVIEQMTAHELEDLAERRVWPARFKEVLRAFLPAPIDITPSRAAVEDIVEPPTGEPISAAAFSIPKETPRRLHR